MYKLNRKELSRLAREFPYISKRHQFVPTSANFETDESYVEGNLKAAAWMLDNSELFFKLLIQYRRVTEITFEGEKSNE